MKNTHTVKIILLTPFFIWLAHYLAVLPHEFAHSFMAWFLGYKQNPLAIHFGGTSWQNILLLININENVNYDFIVSQHHLKDIALIAFAGPGIANGLLYLPSLFLLTRDKIKNHIYWFYFIFWFNFMNLANFYDYVPIRTFAPDGDMAHVAMGLNISPWWIYIFIGYVVAFVIWHFYTNTLIRAFILLDFKSKSTRVFLSSLCTIVLFGYFGMSGFLDSGEISHFLSITSFIIIPGVIAACWPTREWVKRQFILLKNHV